MLSMLPDVSLARWQEQAAHELLTGNGALFPADALTVYHRNLHHAIRSTLTDIFPVTARIVGNECFGVLAADYAIAHPPASPVLADYGTTLPDFLRHHPLQATLPWLSDMAGLEHLLWQGQRTPDLPVMTAADWQVITPEMLLSARWQWHPSVRLFHSPWPVIAIWQIHQEHTNSLPYGWEPPADSPHHALVCRTSGKGTLIPLSPELYAVLKGSMNGIPFASLLETHALSGNDQTILQTMLVQETIVHQGDNSHADTNPI
jgi:hypothetical protein